MKKIFCLFTVLLVICLSLSGCGKTPPLTAEFLSLEEGLEAVKTFYWGSQGWRLLAGGDYLFTVFGNHIVRYSISENRVESIVKLNAPEYWDSYISPSPDGETVMAIAVEFPGGPGETNEILIDYR